VIKYGEYRGSLDGRATLWIKRFLRRHWLNIDLHKMTAADDVDCFHTHPAYAVRIVLWGGYVEEMEGGARRMWRPGMVGIVKPTLSHRIAELRNGTISYSLWIRFKKLAPVELRGSGWGPMPQIRKGVIIHDDRPISWRTADRIARRRLDRRKNYAVIKGQVCSAINWTQGCSGCGDGSGTKGGGCHECGYHGVVRNSMWMPDDGSEPRS
jgi:hypothetical protein